MNLPDDFGSGTDPDQFHISTIGRMIEQNEDVLRQTVQDTYIDKQRQITNTGRLIEEYMTDNERARFQELIRNQQLGVEHRAEETKDVEILR